MRLNKLYNNLHEIKLEVDSLTKDNDIHQREFAQIERALSHISKQLSRMEVDRLQ